MTIGLKLGAALTVSALLGVSGAIGAFDASVAHSSAPARSADRAPAPDDTRTALFRRCAAGSDALRARHDRGYPTRDVSRRHSVCYAAILAESGPREE